MSLTPDHSHFTAGALGEMPPSGPAGFGPALEKNPSLRAEAEAVRAAAERLRAAFRQEPAVFLTTVQRHAVLHPAAAPTRAAAVGRPRRPAWQGSVLATAGVAATLALAAWLWPAPGTGVPADPGASGIPAVAVQPVPGGRTAPRPVGPVPPVGGNPRTGELPDSVLTENSADRPGSGPMAATPPGPGIVPASSPQETGPLNEFAPPVRTGAKAPGPEESLASPAPALR